MIERASERESNGQKKEREFRPVPERWPTTNPRQRTGISTLPWPLGGQEGLCDPSHHDRFFGQDSIVSVGPWIVVNKWNGVPFWVLRCNYAKSCETHFFFLIVLLSRINHQNICKGVGFRCRKLPSRWIDFRRRKVRRKLESIFDSDPAWAALGMDSAGAGDVPKTSKSMKPGMCRNFPSRWIDFWLGPCLGLDAAGPGMWLRAASVSHSHGRRPQGAISVNFQKTYRLFASAARSSKQNKNHRDEWLKPPIARNGKKCKNKPKFGFSSQLVSMQ